jgi:hypothetical protein
MRHVSSVSLSVPSGSSRVQADAAAPTRGSRRRLALGWRAPQKLDRAGWLAAGISLSEFGRVNNWWVGDWVRYGNARWGEKYLEASRITGLDAKTLRNIAYVASRFDVSRRRDNLTWTHHAEVAALSAELQEEWLDRALALRLSPGDLRLELRSAQRARTPTDRDPLHSLDDDVDDTLACPRCGAVIALSEIRKAGGTAA